MSKKRTDKSRYPSRYSPKGWVSAPQYITELICEKKAQKEKKELPIRFWEIKEWKSYFRYQITLANKLINEFGEDAVVAALKDPRCWSTYSLRAPRVSEIAKEKQLSEVDRPKDTEYNINESTEVRHKTNNSKKSIISRLKDLDE
jgi:hypothetical protein